MGFMGNTKRFANVKNIALLMAIALFLSGCRSVPMMETESQTNKQEGNTDPLEGFNRKMWTVNYDYLDPYMLRPAAVAYTTYTPTPIRSGLHNFFSNLDEPASVVNNLFMGNGRVAGIHFNRFWINSTFGIFGLFDIATAAGITPDGNKSFGDTLGHYGIPNGPYIMVPGAGPYTPREAASAVDYTYFPLAYLNVWAAVGKFVIQGLETRASLFGQEQMLENSPDPYAFTREAFLQRQDYKAGVKEEVDESQEELFDSYLEEYQ